MKIPKRLFLLTIAVGLACVDPARLNSTCSWVEPSAQPLDLSKRADRGHLREDARVAGEIEVRFADSTRTSPAQMDSLVDQCRAVLYDSITARHAVTVADLTKAERARNWWIDTLLVFAPMALLAWWATDRVVRRVCRSFEAGSETIAAISVAVLVPVIAAIAVGITQTWAFGVESPLLRNGHVSFRAFYLPAMMHGWITFFSALALCTAAALWRFRRMPLTGRPDSYRPAFSIKRSR
jgi:hypothetical protein